MHAPHRLPTHPPQAAYWALHYGGARTPLVRAVPDGRWPGMYRLAWPDGSISDLANLARCRDAAVVICQRGPPPKNWQLFRWNPSEAPAKALLAHPDAFEASAAGRAA